MRVFALLLPARQRDAVIGDLVEAGDGLWQAFPEICRLALQQRPWIPSLLLAVPCALVAMGVALTLSHAYGLNFVLCNLLVIGASLATGFGTRTVMLSALLTLPACLFCITQVDLECLGRLTFCLLLPPAVLSLAWRGFRLRGGAPLAVAFALTAVTIPLWNTAGAWIPNWALSWPAWYVVFADEA